MHDLRTGRQIAHRDEVATERFACVFLARHVLQKREQAEAELVLSTADEKRVATHIVDRTFVENDERWVIDYKSARLDAIDGLARYAEQYRPQLERYAGLFTREGRPVRKAVFFLAHGKLVEL